MKGNFFTIHFIEKKYLQIYPNILPAKSWFHFFLPMDKI